jgi:hypothetical protein
MKTLLLIIAGFLFALPASAQFDLMKEPPKPAKPDKKNASGNFLPCQRVFVAGSQTYAIKWANKNLFQKTCMAPVADPSLATAILVLRPQPTSDDSAGTQDDANYWVNCSSFRGSIICNDSNGQTETTECYEDRFGGVDCSTYSGTMLSGFRDALEHAMTRNVANAYLYDAKTHKMIWKYEGTFWDAQLMWDSACAKKHRFGYWGPSSRGGVPNGMSCDAKKLPKELLVPRVTVKSFVYSQY